MPLSALSSQETQLGLPRPADEEPPPGPSFGEAFAAGVLRESGAAALVRSARRLFSEDIPEPVLGYSPFEDTRLQQFVNDGVFTAQDVEIFDLSQSPDETQRLIHRVLTEKALDQEIAERPGAGVFGQVVGGVLDPLLLAAPLLPEVLAAQKFKRGANVLHGALRFGGLAVAAETANEVALQHEMLTRSLGETALNISGAAVIGTALGRLVVGLDPRFGQLVEDSMEVPPLGSRSSLLLPYFGPDDTLPDVTFNRLGPQDAIGFDEGPVQRAVARARAEVLETRAGGTQVVRLTPEEKLAAFEVPVSRADVVSSNKHPLSKSVLKDRQGFRRQQSRAVGRKVVQKPKPDALIEDALIHTGHEPVTAAALRIGRALPDDATQALERELVEFLDEQAIEALDKAGDRVRIVQRLVEDEQALGNAARVMGSPEDANIIRKRAEALGIDVAEAQESYTRLVRLLEARPKDEDVVNFLRDDTLEQLFPDLLCP